MKRYLLTLAGLATALTAGARTARPSRAELQQQAVEAMAEADSLRRLSDTQSVLIDSLQQLLDRSETLLAARNAANRTPEADAYKLCQEHGPPRRSSRPSSGPKTPSPRCACASSASRSSRRSIRTA